MALTAAMQTVLSPEQQIDHQVMRQELEDEHRRMRAVQESEAIRGLLIVYRSLSDTEFDRYLGFVESSHGRRFYHALRRALRYVLTHTSRDLGNALGKALREIDRLQGA